MSRSLKIEETFMFPFEWVFKPIDVNNSEFVCFDMKLVFSYILWWNKWLSKELITLKKDLTCQFINVFLWEYYDFIIWIENLICQSRLT
jgi:hypothetical protein